jgi:hypothetical protein
MSSQLLLCEVVVVWVSLFVRVELTRDLTKLFQKLRLVQRNEK